MKQRILDCIASGFIKEALDLLYKEVPDAIQLLGRYNQLERENKLGLIDHGSYTRNLARITQAALHYTSDIKGDVHVHVNQTTQVNITFNMAPKDFGEAVKQLSFAVIEDLCMKAFSTQPTLLDEVLDITSPITRKIRTSRPLEPGQVTDAKAALVQLYTTFITKEQKDTSARQLADLKAIHKSLPDGVDEEGLMSAYDNMEIFLVDNPKYTGIQELRQRRKTLQTSEDDSVKRRVGRLQPRIDAERLWLVQVTNRLIQNLEK